MYFRKTVHCWCVGSSWIDLPVRVFISCLVTLEMPLAILKFKKVSDIVIVIAGLEFISVTQYSLHFGNIVSGVQNHHTVALVGFTYDDVAVFAQCVTAFVFRHNTGMPLALVKKCGHIEFLLQNQQISCDKKSFEFRINTSELSSDVVEVKLGGKKAKIQALTQQFCVKNRENPVRKVVYNL